MGDWQANLEDYLFHVAHHTHTKDLAVDLVLDLFRHLFFLAAIEALVVRITSIHTRKSRLYTFAGDLLRTGRAFFCPRSPSATARVWITKKWPIIIDHMECSSGSSGSQQSVQVPDCGLNGFAI